MGWGLSANRVAQFFTRRREDTKLDDGARTATSGIPPSPSFG